MEKRVIYRIDSAANALLIIPEGLEPIKIRFSQVKEELKKLALKGKLAFNSTQLIADFFTQVEFVYRVALNNQGDGVVTGWFEWGNKQIEASRAAFVCQGPPHLFIEGMSLRFGGEEVDWKWIAKTLAPGGYLIEGDKLKRWKEELEALPGAPKIFLNEQVLQKNKKKPSVFPVLKLCDRWGIFADLWMDYGKGRCFAFHGMETNEERDLEAECGWERDLLETDFIKKQVDNSHYYCPLDKVPKSLTFLLELGWTLHDAKGNRIYKQGSEDLTIAADGNSIVVHGQVHYDEFRVDVSEVVGSFSRRERFISLSPGAVGLIDEAKIQREWPDLATGEVVSSGVKFKRAQIGMLDELLTSSKMQVDPSLRDLRSIQLAFQGINAAPSTLFCGSLRDYQQEGVNWMQRMHESHLHGLLADEMGLGKTVQVLAFLSRHLDKGPHLIVMPKSLLFNWQREIERFLPSVDVYLHQGIARCREASAIVSHQIVLASYSTLRLDSALFEQISFYSVILDEAHWIKNPHSQQAQAVYQLQGDFRLSLTGTPIENRWEDLWSQFHFLMPDLLGSQEEFKAQITAGSADGRYLERIRKKIKPFLKRRTKEEVMPQLQAKMEQLVWIEMEEQQRALYESFLAALKSNLLQKISSDGFSKHRMEVLEGILRLRQICCHPLLADALFDNDVPRNSAKLEALLDDLDEIVQSGRKVLVYSQFTSMLALIASRLREKNWNFVLLDGKTVNREEVVLQFQQDPQISIFLISLKAGGVGLNLTAADSVLIFDPWWNEAVENQAIDRAHRIGQQKCVIAKRYIMRDSVEEKMISLKEHKRALGSDLFEDQASSLSDEDVLSLIQ